MPRQRQQLEEPKRGGRHATAEKHSRIDADWECVSLVGQPKSAHLRRWPLQGKIGPLESGGVFVARIGIGKKREKLVLAAKPVFTKEIFKFFRELQRHNKKTWMDANRERYWRESIEKLPATAKLHPPDAIKRFLAWYYDRIYIHVRPERVYVWPGGEMCRVAQGEARGKAKRQGRVGHGIRLSDHGISAKRCIADLRHLLVQRAYQSSK